MRRLVLLILALAVLALPAAAFADGGTGTTGTSAPAPATITPWQEWALKWQDRAEKAVAAYNRVARRDQMREYSCPRLCALTPQDLGRAYKSIWRHFRQKRLDLLRNAV